MTTTNFVNKRVVTNPPAPKQEPVADERNVQDVILRELKVDPAYQRALKPHHKKIAKNFNKKAAGFLHVNIRPDYNQYTIDGQQRCAAMILLGIVTWPAHIHTLATVQEEAELFNILNGGYGTRVGVGEADLFKALIAAKDPNTLATIAAVEKYGLRFRNRSRTLTWPYIGCTKTARKVCFNYGPEALERICRTIVTCWPQSDDAMDGYLFQGVAMFWNAFPNLKDEHVFTAFKRKPALTIMQTARSKNTSGAGVASGVRLALIDAYNYNRRPQHRIAMPDYNKDVLPESLSASPTEESIEAKLITAQ